ncbi:MAG: orotidine 5'-phosphate decarboxylase [Candidatus Bathyarchaeales archaeon]
MSFRLKMEQTAENKKSNIILALDLPFEKPENRENRENLFFKAERILEGVHPYICAVKFNRHLVLPFGTFNGVQKLVKKVHDLGLMAIMDCKINDIGSTNQTIAEYYYATGFDALTANPFVGWEEGLKPVFDVARRLQRGVILLVYMSHKGASEGYGQTICNVETGEKTPQYMAFGKKALKWNADGVVVGATYPKKIREVHEILGEKIPIYSPGIGVQGGAIESALKAGARYLIVGRTITLSENPAETAKKIRDLAIQS